MEGLPKKVICSTCKITFETYNNGHYCPACHAEYVREWTKKNYVSVKNTQFLYKYGITMDDYSRMFEEQEGLCKICRCRQPNARFKYLSVDHDHETGRVRGLLCMNCNRGLGLFDHDPILLEKAIDYLG